MAPSNTSSTTTVAEEQVEQLGTCADQWNCYRFEVLGIHGASFRQQMGTYYIGENISHNFNFETFVADMQGVVDMTIRQ